MTLMKLNDEQNRGLSVPCTCAVAAGHSLTHDEDCQARFDPMRVPGNGLGSGEEIETHWQKMMPLLLPLRESSSSIRHDELTEHLHHIASECKITIGCRLRCQYYKAKRTIGDHSLLIRKYRNQTKLNDEQIVRWYEHYRRERLRQQPDLSIDLLEQKRQALIQAHDTVLYWISLMRTHDHHNYKMRTTVSTFISESSNARAQALAAYNDMRLERNPLATRFSLDDCMKNGELSREYFHGNTEEHLKYKHYDSLQVLARAKEEREYTITEIRSIFFCGEVEIRRWEHLLEESMHSNEDSLRAMYAAKVVDACHQYRVWMNDLKDVLDVIDLVVEPINPGFDTSYREEFEEYEVGFDMPKNDDEASDWETEVEEVFEG
jgi:hypothetical protein